MGAWGFYVVFPRKNHEPLVGREIVEGGAPEKIEAPFGGPVGNFFKNFPPNPILGIPR